MQVTSGRAAVADENNLTAGEAAVELLLRVVRRNILYSSRAQSTYADGGASPSWFVDAIVKDDEQSCRDTIPDGTL